MDKTSMRVTRVNKLKNSQFAKQMITISNIISRVTLITIGIAWRFIRPFRIASVLASTFGVIVGFMGILLIIDSLMLKSEELKKTWFVFAKSIFTLFVGFYLMTSPLNQISIFVWGYAWFSLVFYSIKALNNFNERIYSLLYLVLAILLMIHPTSLLLLLAYLAIFILFIVQGGYLVILSFKVLKNKGEFYGKDYITKV